VVARFLLRKERRKYKLF